MESWTLDGLAADCELLSEGKILERGSGAANDECPEKEEDCLEDAHGAMLLRLANGQSYWNEAATSNGRPIFSKLPDSDLPSFKKSVMLT